jgi:hypothetical protein
MNPKIADLLERVVWTFLQALAGSITAAVSAASFNVFDWRSALIGGGTAALICAIKVLLVQANAITGQPAMVEMGRDVLLDLIDELFPKAAPVVDEVKAATDPAALAADTPAPAPKPAPIVSTQTMPAVNPAPPMVLVTSPPAPAPAPTVPAFAQAPAPSAPVPSPAPAPALAPVAPSAAAIAALSATEPTP